MDHVLVSDFDDPTDRTKSFQVAVGDDVEVFADEKIGSDLSRNDHLVWVCKVEKFLDKGLKFIPSWYCTPTDIYENNQGDLLDEVGFCKRELFTYKKPLKDVVNVESIYKKVTVETCEAGRRPSFETDYYVRFSYDEAFHSFEDVKPRDTSSTKTIYRVLELYSGCGGFSFLCGESDGICMVPTHAVDMERDSLDTYSLNHPETKSHRIEVAQFLNNCEAFHQICRTYDALGEFDGPEEELKNLKISNLRDLEENRSPLVKIQSEANPDKTEHVNLNEAITRGRVTTADVRKYLLQKRREKVIPLPEDVDVIVGGPPCQGLSGKNRTFKTSNILSDENNRQIKEFVRAIEFFKPNFAVLENVPEVFTREHALYIRYVILGLIKLGYQIRIGVLSAACYGAPQMRFRCFLIAARAGVERLPALPLPTVRPDGEAFRVRESCLKDIAKPCLVRVGEDADLPPPTLIWDAFEDLPEAGNFDMMESAHYRTPAERPYQLYLRRNEGKDTEAFKRKANRFLKHLNKDVVRRNGKLLEEWNSGNTEREANLALGEFLASSFGQQKQENWELHAANRTPEKIAELERLRRRVLEATGKTAKQAIDAFDDGYVGPCMNHRCTAASVGECLRITYLPKDGGTVMSFPGLVRNNGRSCVGHTHGCRELPENGIERNGRIVRLRQDGCPSRTHFLNTKELFVMRWMVNALNKHGRNPRRVFGRLKRTDVFGTLLTEVAASCGCAVSHPFQNRYITIREAARIQGFPDDYMFVATERVSSSSTETIKNVASRFKQIGNAVSPPVAFMLGRAIRRSIALGRPSEESVVQIEDPHWQEAMRLSKKPPFFYESEREVSFVIDLTNDSDIDSVAEG